MGSGHRHASAGRRYLKPLAWAFALVGTFMVVEAVAGFWTRSLALLSDAGHMATDALGLGMALAAIVVADRSSAAGSDVRRRTYGLYRLEILAALANAALLLGVSLYVLYEAVQRLRDPADVASLPMLIVAVGGLVVNVVAWRLLREGSEVSLNLQGAYLEILADLAGSVGAILAALILLFTGWPYADPLFGALIGLFILPRALRLGRQALRILVQAAPPHVDLEELRHDLLSIPGVVDVHDLHVWTLTSDMDVASVHVMTAEGVDPHPVLDEARRLLQEDYHLGHATLQVEPDTHEGCAEIAW